MNFDELVGIRLKTLREYKGFRLSSVAKLLNITSQQFAKYEKGTTRITARRLIQICEIISPEINLNYFFLDLPYRSIYTQFPRDKKIQNREIRCRSIEEICFRFGLVKEKLIAEMPLEKRVIKMHICADAVADAVTMPLMNEESIMLNAKIWLLMYDIFNKLDDNGSIMQSMIIQTLREYHI